MEKGVLLSLKSEVPFPSRVSIGQYSRIGNFARLEASSDDSFVSIGKNCWVQRHTTMLTFEGQISIGDNVSVQPFGVLWGPGEIKIGNDVRIGPRVSIIAGNHRFDDLDQPIRSQGMDSKGIVIEENCWLGAHAVILDGVTIASGSVIAAGAVVTKSTAKNSINGGVPAKQIGTRAPS